MIDRERIDDIWSRHLSGDCLTAGEQQSILDALSDSSLMAELFAEERIDGMLRSMGESAEDAQSFTKAFVDRLKAENNAAMFVADFARRAQQEVPVSSAKVTRLRPVALAAAAAMILFAAGVALLFSAQQPQPAPQATSAGAPAAPFARVSHTSGAVTVSGRKPGAELKTRDVVEVPFGASATINFEDGSTLKLAQASQAMFEERDGEKFIEVNHGSITASVSKQPAGKPMIFRTPGAELKVLGTQLIVSSSEQQTRLEVIEGKVALTRKSDAKTVEVAAGMYAVATPETELAARKIPFLTADEYAYHEGMAGVYQAQFSPDGRLLAIACGDSVALTLLWDVEARRYRAPLEGHSQGVAAVAFSPDGRYLATGSADRTIRLWDTTNWSVQAILHTEGLGVHALAFSPDGKSLAAACKHHAIQIWNLSNSEVRKLVGHTGDVRAVSFTPDGATLISGGEDKCVKIWNLADGRVVRSIPHEGWVRGLAISPRGDAFVSGDATGTIRRFDLKSGDEQLTQKAHDTFIRYIDWSARGSSVAVGSEDNNASLWDAETFRQIATFKVHRADVTSVSVSPDGKTVATASHDNTVTLWNAHDGTQLYTLYAPASHSK